MNNSTFKDWNLKEIKDMTNVSQLVLDKTITPENIKELFKGVKDKNGNEYMPFKDYLNRNLVLTRKNFEYHTSKKYLGDNELRHELFAHVKDILNNPDELWITKSESGLRYRYVKFFNYNNENTAILVDTEIKDFGTQITSWHFLKVEETQKRKGLLVKSNP
ncbi:MAG TPA: PBECR2 nuclease fold domain-containing protein [Crocinitomicaceae bacterium]|nr:PBECR2 nuclease fold domain-containing protein [Crocinitomicaceae bacterium]